MDRNPHVAHVLAVPYPSQGHVNPLLQLCKRLAYKGTKTTLAITNYMSKTTSAKSDTVAIDTFSDGCDEGGYAQAESVDDYLTRMEIAGSKTLAQLIDRLANSGRPVDCVVYDGFLPWALDVAKSFGIKGACFFTQACAVNFVYYSVHHGHLRLPVSAQPVHLPSMPPLHLQDMPSFIYVHGSYPAYFQMVLNQFSNVDKADFILVNTFYKLEEQVIDEMAKVSPILTIGPTLPSLYLDNRVNNDNDYGLSLFQPDSSTCINWLDTKPEQSVVYVAFGSMADLSKNQIEELAWGLKRSNFHFLWVVRTSNEEQGLPKDFMQEITQQGLLVKWSPQLKVLSHKAVGCFFSHGGWNSTIEALSIGVPMVVMPQWTDQTMNAKLVQDVWKMGKRVRVDKDEHVGREEIEKCVREVMEGEEMKRNARKWKDLAKEAASEGGTSDKNIDFFISEILKKG